MVVPVGGESGGGVLGALASSPTPAADFELEIYDGCTFRRSQLSMVLQSRSPSSMRPMMNLW